MKCRSGAMETISMGDPGMADALTDDLHCEKRGGLPPIAL